MEPEVSDVQYERCNKQGKIFAMANRLGHDLAEYAERYMKSALTTEGGDSDYSYYQIASPSYSLDMVDDEELHEERAADGRPSNAEAYWIGFFYRYISVSTSMSGEKTMEKLPFDKMRSLYRELGRFPKEEAGAKIVALLREGADR